VKWHERGGVLVKEEGPRFPLKQTPIFSGCFHFIQERKHMFPRGKREFEKGESMSFCGVWGSVYDTLPR
jgi:hypothetical protein